MQDEEIKKNQKKISQKRRTVALIASAAGGRVPS
jgi:hypothetical protein